MKSKPSKMILILFAVMVMTASFLTSITPLHFHIYDHAHHHHDTNHHSGIHSVSDKSHEQHKHNIATIEINGLADATAWSNCIQILKFLLATCFYLFLGVILRKEPIILFYRIPYILRKISLPPPMRAPPIPTF